jgi:hypothetical protein
MFSLTPLLVKEWNPHFFCWGMTLANMYSVLLQCNIFDECLSSLFSRMCSSSWYIMGSSDLWATQWIDFWRLFTYNKWYMCYCCWIHRRGRSIFSVVVPALSCSLRQSAANPKVLSSACDRDVWLLSLCVTSNPTIHIITLGSTQPGIFLGVQEGQRLRLITSPPDVSWLSRNLWESEHFSTLWASKAVATYWNSDSIRSSFWELILFTFYVRNTQ